MTAHIYTILARDVVPGMLHCTRDGKFRELVTGVARAADGISMWGNGWFRCCPLDSTTYVSLPGPSPRELLCTCASYLPWAPNPGDPPTDHWNRERWPECSDPCPVAPNLDPKRGAVRGGLRLWPVGGKRIGLGWSVPTARDLGYHEVSPAVVSSYARRGPVDGWEEGIFMEFFEPPTVPDLPTAIEQRPTPWDPEDVHGVLG